MTEAEAKKKWCPYSSSRIVVWQKSGGTIENAVYARPGASPSTLCIGSACMAWRWERASSDAPSAVRYPGDTGAAADAHGFWHRDGKPEGFCGLAGRPA